jgi:hypothetical protein
MVSDRNSSATSKGLVYLKEAGGREAKEEQAEVGAIHFLVSGIL